MRLFLKSIVSDIYENNIEDKCKRCGLDIELRAVEKVSFDIIASTFAIRTIT